MLIYSSFSQGASKTQEMDSVHALKIGLLSLTEVACRLVIIQTINNLQICQKMMSAIKQQELL